VLIGGQSNQGQGNTMITEGNKSKLKWMVYPTPPEERERKDLKKGNFKECQRTTDFPVHSSLEEFSTSTFTICFFNKNPFTFCSPINFAKLSHFPCLLILYLAEKKNPYP
jgi:hypothetical protein